MAVWLIGVHREEPWYHELATIVMFLSFFVGILFLGLYYRYEAHLGPFRAFRMNDFQVLILILPSSLDPFRYFHVKRLSYGSSSSYPTNNNPPEPYTYVTPSGTYIVNEHNSDPNGTTKNGNQVKQYFSKPIFLFKNHLPILKIYVFHRIKDRTLSKMVIRCTARRTRRMCRACSTVALIRP